MGKERVSEAEIIEDLRLRIRAMETFHDAWLSANSVQRDVTKALDGAEFTSPADVARLQEHADQIRKRIAQAVGARGEKRPNEISPGVWVELVERLDRIDAGISVLKDDAFFEQKLVRQLRDLRNKAGLTQEELAKRLQLTDGAIRHIEGGRRPLTMTRAREWANACGSSMIVDFTNRDWGTPQYKRYDPLALTSGVNTLVERLLALDPEEPTTDQLARALTAYADAFVKSL